MLPLSVGECDEPFIHSVFQNVHKFESPFTPVTASSSLFFYSKGLLSCVY